MEKEVVYIMLVFNMVISIAFFIQKRCEIPFFLALFNMMVEYRNLSLRLGYSKWVDFDYEIYFVFNQEYADKVSELILLGTTILMYSFILFYTTPTQNKGENNQTLRKFVNSKKVIIFVGLILFTIFQLIVSGNISQGYGFLAKLGNSSFVILFFLLFLSLDPENNKTKLVYILIFLGLGFVTYDPGLRFQFLGWIIPVGFYLVRNINPIPKTISLFFGVFLVLLVFSAAGVLRYQKFHSMTVYQLYYESIDRMKIADDINFIDGFIMVYQIYPKHLDYTNGMDHLNIFLRPIPRTIWPNKPLAGWVQNYYAKHGKKGEWAAGFSPTIYGVFYSEMGTIGIVFFSALWATFLSYIYKLTQLYSSDLKYFLVGMMLASMIPLFRSGDLPGDFAIVLMSYWPILLFIKMYNKYLKRRLQHEK